MPSDAFQLVAPIHVAVLNVEVIKHRYLRLETRAASQLEFFKHARVQFATSVYPHSTVHERTATEQKFGTSTATGSRKSSEKASTQVQLLSKYVIIDHFWRAI